MKIDIIPNKEQADLIRAKIRDNDGYCPCQATRNEDTKCICKEFVQQKEGMCHCGLYIKTREPGD